MMSKKCKYAFKALTHLAKHFPDKHCQTAEIARVENIPRKFLELILLDLKKAAEKFRTAFSTQCNINLLCVHCFILSRF